MNPARERFVAFAFCWADILIELDNSHKVLFAGGATKPLLGFDANALVGKKLHGVGFEERLRVGGSTPPYDSQKRAH